MHLTLLINHGFPDVIIVSPLRCHLFGVRGKQPVFTATGSGNLPELLHGDGVSFQIKVLFKGNNVKALEYLKSYLQGFYNTQTPTSLLEIPRYTLLLRALHGVINAP